MVSVIVISWLVFGPLFSAAPSPVVRATFIGNAAIHLTDGAAALLIDFPYESGAFGYMTWSRDTVPSGPRPLCVISHAHRDHFEPVLAPELCAAVLGPADVVRAAGVTPIPIAHDVRWQGIVIRPTRTPHANAEHYSYLIEWRGVRLYFSGDTESGDALLAARQLDAAFVSPWLLASIAKQGARIDTARVIVYHHRPDDDLPDVQDRLVPAPGRVIELRGTPAKEP